ncbi:hypothetical protein DMUE_4293 [Dictyocoela muelleri]|nr:hypothetical protein DMUE_4293 [Dictyocoela muelleri]
MSNVYKIILPLVYIFMKTCSKNSYTRAFNFLKEKIRDKYPSFINIDLEMASFVSFKEVSSDSKNNGCLFHFSQLLFKNIRKLGMVNIYKKHVKFRKIFRIFLSLAFIPFKF